MVGLAYSFITELVGPGLVSDSEIWYRFTEPSLEPIGNWNLLERVKKNEECFGTTNVFTRTGIDASSTALTTISNDSNLLQSEGLQEQLKQLRNSSIIVIRSNRLGQLVHLRLSRLL
jgi:hypothetical protein